MSYSSSLKSGQLCITLSLKEAIDSMLSNPAKLIQIEENAKNMAITDARERIADIIISLAK